MLDKIKKLKESFRGKKVELGTDGETLTGYILGKNQEGVLLKKLPVQLDLNEYIFILRDDISKVSIVHLNEIEQLKRVNL